MLYETSLTLNLVQKFEQLSIILLYQLSDGTRYTGTETRSTIIKLFVTPGDWRQQSMVRGHLCAGDQMPGSTLVMYNPLNTHQHGCAEICYSFVRVCPISVPLLCGAQTPGGGQVMIQITKQLQNNLLSRISWLWHIISHLIPFMSHEKRKWDTWVSKIPT